MADEHVPTRDVAYYEENGFLVAFPTGPLPEERPEPPSDGMPDPLIAFYWARLDEHERLVRDAADDQEAWLEDLPGPRFLDDLAAKKAILDDYARYCADTSNPAREVICGVTRTAIRRLASVYAGHPDFQQEWRP